MDVIKSGKITRAKRTITIGVVGRREAQSKVREIMSTLNRADYVITSQINVGGFLDEYLLLHVNCLAASTRQKYRNHIRKYIRPAFENLMLCDLQPLLLQKWLDGKAEPEKDGKSLAWATRNDLPTFCPACSPKPSSGICGRMGTR